ncbi:hypothetical protein [Psychrobacter sp. CAL346-MNA-CIBAN-0220]|uniref:hypothetical protein n=1 Tax=Psychrobacter sp. CAL346-MNA-CIBAN-0220 TaxID=3140457 RepID=UPI00331AED20
MEETMSSYSFSHQFYQHWTLAPEPVRAAIVQELTDITTLLSTDTPFEEFVFSLPDLDAHLDQLYSTHQTQQAAAQELADKQARDRKVAEQQRLVEEQKKRAAAEKEAIKKETKRQLEISKKNVPKEQVNADAKDQQKNGDNSESRHNNNGSNASAVINKGSHETAKDKVSIISTGSINAIASKSSPDIAIDLTLKNSQLNATHEDLIHELEMHIDDYLSEQMTQMSENLKAWLRSEVSQQLLETRQSTDSIAKKK